MAQVFVNFFNLNFHSEYYFLLLQISEAITHLLTPYTTHKGPF